MPKYVVRGWVSVMASTTVEAESEEDALDAASEVLFEAIETDPVAEMPDWEDVTEDTVD